MVAFGGHERPARAASPIEDALACPGGTPNSRDTIHGRSGVLRSSTMPGFYPGNAAGGRRSRIPAPRAPGYDRGMDERRDNPGILLWAMAAALPLLALYG